MANEMSKLSWKDKLIRQTSDKNMCLCELRKMILLAEARVQETDEIMTRSPVEYICTYLFRIHCSLKSRRKEETVHSKWMCFVRNREEQNSNPFIIYSLIYIYSRASLMRKRKNLPAKQETQVWSLLKDSWNENDNQLHFLPGNSHDREACWSTVCGVPKELNNLLTKERQHIDSYLWELAH